MGFTTLFGGSNIATAFPTYLNLSISVNTILGWPIESNANSPIAAELMDVTATAGGLTLQFSDARQISNGYCVAFNNVGANTFSVLDAQGNTLLSIASGQVWQLYLADNSTLQGTWRIFQYGAGVSSANAAGLAGSGLKAITTTLNERIIVNPQAANYVIQASDRASCIEWVGGSGGIFTSPSPATVGSDWFCYIKNNGTGTVTFTPSSGTIDGSATKVYNPNDSSIILTDGSNFISMGFGQSVAAVFSFVQIAVTGGNLTLTGAQLNRVSYKFTGVLTSNQTITVPGSIQQYWIDNETTGAFTLTVTTGGGSTQTIAQGSRNILYCDGTNVINAVTAGAGGTTLVADGSAAAPGLAWASDTQMGLYKVAADTLGFSTTGIFRGQINSLGNWSIAAPTSGVSLAITAASQTGLSVNSTSVGDTEILVTTTTTGNAQFRATAFGVTNWSFGTVRSSGSFAIANAATLTGPAVTITTAGNVTIAAPTSGSALTINAAAGAQPLVVLGASNNEVAQFDSTQANGPYIILTSSASAVGYVGSALALSSGNATDLAVRSQNVLYLASGGGTNRVTIASAGNVTIAAPSSGTALAISAAANAYGMIITGSSTSGQSLGLEVNAGTTSADLCFVLQNQAQTVTFCEVFGDGHGLIGASTSAGLQWTNAGAITLNATSGTPLTVKASGTALFEVLGTTAPTVEAYGPTAAALVDMTPDKGSWTTTLSGPYTSNPSGTLKWERQGTQVTVWADASITGASTSNNTISASGLPAAITPSSNRAVICGALVDGSGNLGFVTVNTGGTLSISMAKTAGGANPQEIVPGSFTNGQTSGIGVGWSITYSL